MPTLEELLNLKDQSLASFAPKEDTEESIVSDALTAPVRDEYLKLLEKRKKEAEAGSLFGAGPRPGGTPRPEGMRSLLGAPSPEDLAAEDLSEYDKLRSLSEGERSQFDSAKLRKIKEELSPLKKQIADSSDPFYPTPNGAPIPFYPTPTGAPIPESALAKKPISPETAKRAIATKAQEAPEVEKPEADVAALLKAGESESSKLQDLLDRYKEAQERQRSAQLGIGLSQAAEKIGAAIAGVKPGDQAVYEQAMKQAGGITEEFKEAEAVRKEAEKNDPTSEASKSMRALLKEQGITVPESISAAFIEKQYPQFANIMARREAAKERAELRSERAQERAERQFDRLDQEKRGLALRIAPKIQNEQYKTLTELSAQKALIDEAVNDPNPQRDTTMFYSFVKALDPNSVVREGEIKFSQAARSIPTSIRGVFNKAYKGQMLLPEERKNIQDFMNQRLTLAKSSWEASARPYLKQADEAKIDRELVAPGSTSVEALAPSPKKPTIKLDQKLSGKAGKTFTHNGKKYVVNPDETSATEL